MMQVPGCGTFVRVLLPIKLAGGDSLTYGLWLAIDPAHLGPIREVWFEPQYVELIVTGRLANAVQPWGMLGAPVEAEVRNPDYTPYCARSTDPVLHEVLTGEWPHDVVPEGF